MSPSWAEGTPGSRRPARLARSRGVGRGARAASGRVGSQRAERRVRAPGIQARRRSSWYGATGSSGRGRSSRPRSRRSASSRRLIAEEAIDCGYARRGAVTLAGRPATCGTWRRSGGRSASTSATRRCCSVPAELRDEIGSPGYHGGLLDPAAGGLHPATILRRPRRRRGRAGAAIVEGVEVLGVDAAQRRDDARDVRAARCDADEVLVATNGYTGAAFPGLRRRVVPVGSYIVATAPLGRGRARTADPADAGDERHLESAPLFPAVGRRRTGVRRAGVVHADRRRAKRRILGGRDAAGVSRRSRRCRSSSPGPATSASPATGCRTPGGSTASTTRWRTPATASRSPPGSAPAWATRSPAGPSCPELDRRAAGHPAVRRQTLVPAGGRRILPDEGLAASRPTTLHEEST